MGADRELRVHRDWIGPLQPIGLVVSPPALLASQAFPDKNILPQQQALLALVVPIAQDDERSTSKRTQLPLHFEALATQVLGWKATKIGGAKGGPALPESLAVVLPEFGETLRPTYAVPALADDEAEWMILVQELPDDTDFDEVREVELKTWNASPQARIERLLRETGVPIGILMNGRSVRLVFAPRGESSGHITWPVYALCEVAGRTLLSALCMLLGSPRLFTLPRAQRLPHILKESRKYQNVVSTKLAGQVLEALNELLRGFQSANDAQKGELLGSTVRLDPDHIYGGLLAVLLRLVFILYAEERGLLSSSSAYVRNYSLVGLFEKLRADSGRFPDTMDQRYGAWSRLLVLFRMVHDGARRGDLRLPPRYGHLFDPDGWAFLEGRQYGLRRVMGASVTVPKVGDGVVLRVLEKLLLLDGDRLSYRALDVEQIGSVYENMMGFRLKTALETSIGIGRQHVVVGLETLLKETGSKREKHLKDVADVELATKSAEALRKATSIEQVVGALGRRVSPLTPRPIPKGGIYLQPTDERRRSGSHYTPRELTEPIVRTTLRPILDGLGRSPMPEQILALNICDPAMGSGAFLVETCRQLADHLVKAYDIHGRPSDVPPDEDILLYAQRQIAQHCLYGVDKNRFAVDLGKLSLWLTTLARDHAFTFLDHAIRHGDSLVGLSREQIASFHWSPGAQLPVVRAFVDKAIDEAVALRRQIEDLANSDDVRAKRELLGSADYALAKVRLIGDLGVASFFSGASPAAREAARSRHQAMVHGWLSSGTGGEQLVAIAEDLRDGENPVPCFHWEIEFPEVFGVESPGFDAFVGNPPFAGVVTLAQSSRPRYTDWLRSSQPGGGGKADLVAFFFRRVFALLRSGGCAGLLATKTVAQGDTRRSGLSGVISDGGVVYSARRRIVWPGRASVIVSAVHFRRGKLASPVMLDNRPVERINPYLLPSTIDVEPGALSEGSGLAFLGVKPGSRAFVFEDTKASVQGLGSLKEFLEANPNERGAVAPYFGGSELYSDDADKPTKWVWRLGLMTEKEIRTFPNAVVSLKATLQRLRKAGEAESEEWWRFSHRAQRLFEVIADKKLVTVLVRAEVSDTYAFLLRSTEHVYSNKAIVFCIDDFGAFAILQSTVHELWARMTSSTMKDDLSYVPSDSFETFPHPRSGWADSTSELRAAGEAYYSFRETLRKRGQGLTTLYNRFHDPEESDVDIQRLRDLHAAMDRAVLDAYEWSDLRPTPEFLLDYTEEEDETETTASRRKKPWRYRWPDDARDDVLARLLELNAERSQRDVPSTSDVCVSSDRGGKRGRRSRAKKAEPAIQRLPFEGESVDE